MSDFRKLPGAALLALLPLGTAWAQGPVSGTLTDARSGQPLPGATLLLDGAAVGTTDANGLFALPAVAAGAHELFAQSSGEDRGFLRLDVDDRLVLDDWQESRALTDSSRRQRLRPAASVARAATAPPPRRAVRARPRAARTGAPPASPRLA